MQPLEAEAPQASAETGMDRSSERSALLAKRLSEAITSRDRTPGISKRASTGSLPLSFVQARIWHHCRYHSADHAYHRLLAVRLHQTVNVSALEKSISCLLRRHDILRTTFSILDRQPRQIVGTDTMFPLRVIAVPAIVEAEWEAKVAHIAREEAQRPFDLEAGPLFRACLIEPDVAASHPAVLIFTLHHLISDGWSDSILLRELLVFYANPLLEQEDASDVLPTSGPQYGDFVLWQQERMSSASLVRQQNYWRQRLKQTLPILALPTDRSRPSTVTTRGARYTFTIDPVLAAALATLGHQEGCTLFMTLLTGFKTVLHRDCEQTDIHVVSPVAARTHIDTENMIGCFINSLVLRTSFDGDPTFREALKRVRTTCLEAYSNQEVPYEKIIEETPIPHGARVGDLFRVLFQLRNVPKGPFVAGEFSAERLMVDVGIALYDLNIEFYENEEGLHGFIDYKTDLFGQTAIAGLVRRFLTLLAGAVATPETRLSRLSLLSVSERNQLLVEWNDTQADYPRDRCLHQLFEEQVKRTPQAIAVECSQQRLTYAELNSHANQLARLLKKQGVVPNRLIALCLRRDSRMVVALLAILKAGGAYVALDPAYPSERLNQILQAAHPILLLTQQDLLPRLPTTSANTVCLPCEPIGYAESSPPDLTTSALPSDLAYVLFTSGSTGQPKGVAITHQSPVALVAWAQSVYSSQELAGVVFSTSLSFDLSVFELFVPLCSGGRVLVAENALAIPSLPLSWAPTLINTVPSAIKELLRSGKLPSTVRTINLAGEALSSSLVDALYSQTGVQKVYDLYGPSEDTTYSTYALRKQGELATIGRPIANTRVYILDAHQEPVAVGIPGELYLGGAGLAQGYLNQTELTAEKFVPDPFCKEPEARLYRTGDLCRYLPDGNIEFLGRMDHQVKIRGFRIELGEIETILLQHPQVREAVVMVREDVPGDKRLAAYIVGNEISANALREYLRSKLPDYTMPAAFVFLEVLPLTANGKIDRKALPAPDYSKIDVPGAFVAPRSPVEARLG